MKLHFHNGVYSLVVVIWRVIVQRLHPKGTLLAVVQEAVRQLPPGLVRRPCKRLREGSLSSHTGAYNQARRKLPREVVERVSDRIFEQLVAPAPEAWPGLGRRLFLLDGSTLWMPNTPELAAAYPPTSNQHGPSHWGQAGDVLEFFRLASAPRRREASPWKTFLPTKSKNYAALG